MCVCMCVFYSFDVTANSSRNREQANSWKEDIYEQSSVSSLASRPKWLWAVPALQAPSCTARSPARGCLLPCCWDSHQMGTRDVGCSSPPVTEHPSRSGWVCPVARLFSFHHITWPSMPKSTTWHLACTFLSPRPLCHPPDTCSHCLNLCFFSCAFWYKKICPTSF